MTSGSESSIERKASSPTRRPRNCKRLVWSVGSGTMLCLRFGCTLRQVGNEQASLAVVPGSNFNACQFQLVVRHAFVCVVTTTNQFRFTVTNLGNDQFVVLDLEKRE